MNLHTDSDPPGHPAPPRQASEEVTSALFREFFKISPDGILLLDNNDYVLKANPAFLKLFGYELDEVVGKRVNDLIVDPAFREEASELSRHALNSHEVRHEGLRCRSNGDLINVEIFGTPLMLDNRQVGIYAIYRDITARCQAEDMLEQSESKHRSIVECMNDGYFEVDLAGNLLFFNQALARVLDQHPDRMVELNTRELFDNETNQQLFEQFNRIYRTGRPESCVSWQLATSTGGQRHLEASVSLVHSDSGKSVGFRGVVRDVTDRVEALEALRESQKLFRLATENTGQLIYDYDLATGQIRWSGAIESVLGIDQAQAEHFNLDNWEDCLHPEDRARAVHLLDETSRTGEPYRLEYRLVRKQGDIVHIEDRGTYLRDTDGRIVRLIGTMTDISERRRQELEIAYQATHDALTGLSNRFHFEETVNRLNRDALSSNRTHTFLYMDLDQFKVVNDTCGHNAGDELLRMIAARIGRLVRRDDLLARLGGDEFGLLLADCDTDRGVQIAEKVIQELNEFQFQWEAHRFSIGISIGLVALDGRLNYIDLLKAADQACYVAKDHGRNRHHVYHEEDKVLRQRSAELQAVADVNTAIMEDRFELHIQRIASMGDNGQGQCFEVLLRMRGRDGKLIPPGQFILGAERYNRMGAIDRWVVEHSIRRIGQLGATQQLGEDHWFSINLSGSSINDHEFREFVCTMLTQFKVNPAHVCFEVTESSAITHHKNAIRFLQAVRSMGCRVMLDDFGSGLSSFAYLKMLPIDFIKIDGSLIRGITRSGFDLAIVKAIHDVACVLGKPVIAEHVETTEELDLVRSIGVDYAQGFLLHRPEPWITSDG